MNGIVANIVLGWLKALVETIIIECGFAFALGVKLKEQPIVLLANVATNPFLNALMTLCYIFLPFTFYYPLLAVLEIAVVFVEGFIYKKAKVGRMNTYLIALILNVLSFSIGMIINYIIK